MFVFIPDLQNIFPLKSLVFFSSKTKVVCMFFVFLDGVLDSTKDGFDPFHGFYFWLFVPQTLAIYDRFGRLMLGSEEQPKDVLEYLIIERHLMNPYGRWRLHGKIVPSWAPAKDPVIRVRTCKILMLSGNKK